MNSLRVLVVKTSSLGDVVHALPAVHDACARGAQIDWVVEEAFADIPRLHPSVNRVIPVAWRRWRKNLRASRDEMRAFYAQLREHSYDVVIDGQGLIKSALVSSLANGPIQGFSHTTAREPWAAFFYRKGHAVPRAQHAIDRQRQLFAAVLGYQVPDNEFTTGLEKPVNPDTANKAVVLLHGTTWETKHWPEAMWVNLAELAQADGYEPILTWGNAEEHLRAQRIAATSGAKIQDRVSLLELSGVLAGAAAVVGVDSGLCHLSAALGTPTLGLYGPTNSVLTGCRGRYAQYAQASTLCSPCLQKRCTRYQGEPLSWQGAVITPPCFATLPPASVWQQALELMAVRS